MANRKVVFIIMEGPADETALGFQFDYFFKNDNVLIDVIHGDITTRNNVNIGNIIKTINEEILCVIKNKHYKKSDICRIIHLMDTDGAFINDNNIVLDEGCDKTFYSIDHILTNDVEKIKKRNDQKKHNMLRLFNNNKIGGIPYKAFYMSANLDHVLYNKNNLTDEEKEKEAYKFAKKYKDNLADFICFINSDKIYSGENYIDSVNYLSNDLNSLHRHSNLALLFNEKQID